MTITIEQIESNWAKDSKIDQTNISLDSSQQLELHSKYHRILNWCRKELRNALTQQKRLIHLRTEYYLNSLSPQQMKEMGWTPNPKIVIKSELDRYLEADDLIISSNLRTGELHDMVTYCESIIKAIYQKPFITKNIIEDKKFISGII